MIEREGPVRVGCILLGRLRPPLTPSYSFFLTLIFILSICFDSSSLPLYPSPSSFFLQARNRAAGLCSTALSPCSTLSQAHSSQSSFSWFKMPKTTSQKQFCSLSNLYWTFWKKNGDRKLSYLFSAHGMSVQLWAERVMMSLSGFYTRCQVFGRHTYLLKDEVFHS